MFSLRYIICFYVFSIANFWIILFLLQLKEVLEAKNLELQQKSQLQTEVTTLKNELSRLMSSESQATKVTFLHSFFHTFSEDWLKSVVKFTRFRSPIK